MLLSLVQDAGLLRTHQTWCSKGSLVLVISTRIRSFKLFTIIAISQKYS